jgi:hypothetical protein
MNVRCTFLRQGLRGSRGKMVACSFCDDELEGEDFVTRSYGHMTTDRTCSFSFDGEVWMSDGDTVWIMRD